MAPPKWLGAMLLLTGCGNDDAVVADGCAPFTAEFAIKDKFSQPADVFAPGEPITFEMVLTNTSAAAETLSNPDPCELVAFTVSDRSNQTIWGSFDGRACATVVWSFRFGPGESGTATAEWQQRTRDGTHAPESQYTAHASVRPPACAFLSSMATFRIR